MNALIHELVSQAPVLTDGAWGTQLQARGLPIGACPDAWNLTAPEKVEEVARAYVEAGSRIILTNTFGASRLALERHGVADQTVEINRRGAEISVRAAKGAARVFASMGPTGRMLAMGEVTGDELRAAFREQAFALAEGGVDGFVVETMGDLTEAALAVAAAKETGLPVAACMVYGAGKAGDRTMMGNTPEQAAAELAAAGADVIGSNCGTGGAGMLPICQRLRKATSLPLWIKPNAGLPQLVGGTAVYSATPESFVEEALALVRAGATFIGGCCGTGPAFIQTLKEALKGSQLVN